jgi:hypothetical protein
MERVESTQRVFDDLKRRISILPRLRHKAMQEELTNVLTIVNQLERALISHVASDSDENEASGIIAATIDKLATNRNAESQVPVIRMHLLRNFSINISESALLNRVKRHFKNGN